MRLGAMRLRGPVLAFLALSVVARSADAVPHSDLSYVPFVVALFLLPAWYGSGIARQVWQQHRWWLLGTQALLLVLLFALFGPAAPGGLSYLLGSLVLLAVRAPWSWLLFAAIGAAELGLRLRVGLPVDPPVTGAGWVIITYLNSGLMIFGLARLGDMVARLDAARSELADAAVTRQRLATADRLRAVVDSRLDDVVRRGATALATLAAAPDRARSALAEAGEVARLAAADARRIVAGSPAESTAAGAGEEVVAPQIARGIVALVIVLFGVQALLNALAPTGTNLLDTAGSVVVLLTIPVVLALVLWHTGLYTGGRRPRGWQWTLAAQAVATCGPYLFDSTRGAIFAGFLGGSALLLIRHPLRWAAFAAAVAYVPFTSIFAPPPLEHPTVSWTIYATAVVAASGIAVFGLSRLAVVAAQLAVAGTELAELAAVRERLRMARDTHDLLGLGLSAVALKTDLAAALVEVDPARAGREIEELLRVAAAARADARSVTDGSLRPDLATELRIASDVLGAAGMDVHVEGGPAGLPAEVDGIMATVLREAVTNVLRHSSARRVDVLITTDALTVRNDGAGRPGRPGRGLANLEDRVRDAGGTFAAGQDGDLFELRALIPATRAVAAS
ncbi:sensor histidine kinase [Pseudonocardia sp. CA-107938]|uniref:sensor histidine kinase n=1 Tax=Pseudonocardia sp. CA-107938 TaxID=3240021 RepID=UPI003D9178E6